VVELGDPVLGVDQAGVLRPGAFDEGPNVVGTSVERDRDGQEALGAELLVERLPDRQVLAAASPGRVGDEQDLLAAVIGEAVDLST
jgi:hypothetical protein